MTEIAEAKNKTKEQEESNESLRPKRWDEALEKPLLNYSDFYDEDVGQIPGLCCWEIENFVPNLVEDGILTSFYFNIYFHHLHKFCV